ncbi:metal ABC transporter permease [Alicyclobacillus suci]|uniref:metal ABC transporter permease n=1 Tax=Alicyclobacillus suci TaxID=2816080 RepID=UPI001A8CE1C4|nr:metal ABC transporter permease [Alicyclobacillus suci]
MGQFLQMVFPLDLITLPFMFHALLSGTVVAILSGLVGFFVILRGSSFVAHVLPKAGFAGAAGAVLLDINPLVGLVVFALGGALSIGMLGKRGRHDVVTALTLVVALGTGALFLTLNEHYATGAYALLFGQLVGVSLSQVLDTVVLGLVCVLILGVLYRPLLFASIMRDSAEARGISSRKLEMAFLIVVGLATAVTVPVVGALLSFSLMIGPAATARYLTRRPGTSLVCSVAIAILTIWAALVLGYDTSWPIGFFVSSISALLYGVVRVGASLQQRRVAGKTDAHVHPLDGVVGQK